jgi:hypothetical protein
MKRINRCNTIKRSGYNTAAAVRFPCSTLDQLAWPSLAAYTHTYTQHACSYQPMLKLLNLHLLLVPEVLSDGAAKGVSAHTQLCISLHTEQQMPNIQFTVHVRHQHTYNQHSSVKRRVSNQKRAVHTRIKKILFTKLTSEMHEKST